MKYFELPEEEIIKDYLEGISMTKLSLKYDVSRYVITDRLRKNNIKLFDHGFFLRKTKNINENYFDIIDSEEKAYFLGLLYADGCNHYLDKNKKITISLQENDKYILELFSKAVLGDVHLQFIKKRHESHKNQYNLTFHSRTMSEKLFNLGCVNNKSLTLKFPEWLIDHELQRHFIRGYFDGDGTVGSFKRKDRKNSLSYFAGIISTLNFCENTSLIIKNNIGINVLLNTNIKNNITTKLDIKGRLQILKFLDWLYKDATVYLPRKYDKYISIKR